MLAASDLIWWVGFGVILFGGLFWALSPAFKGWRRK